MNCGRQLSLVASASFPSAIIREPSACGSNCSAAIHQVISHSSLSEEPHVVIFLPTINWKRLCNDCSMSVSLSVREHNNTKSCGQLSMEPSERQRRSVGYRRPGRTAILPPPKVVRCPCPLTILMPAAKLIIS